MSSRANVVQSLLVVLQRLDVVRMCGAERGAEVIGVGEVAEHSGNGPRDGQVVGTRLRVLAGAVRTCRARVQLCGVDEHRSTLSRTGLHATTAGRAVNSPSTLRE